MLKRFGLLVSLAALVSFFSGCSSKTTITSDSGETTTVTATATLAQNMGSTLKASLVEAGMSSADADTVVNAGIAGASAARIGGKSKFSAVTIQTVTTVAPVLAEAAIAGFALLTSMSDADKSALMESVIVGVASAIDKYKKTDGTEDLEAVQSEVVKSATGAAGSVFAESDLDNLTTALGKIMDGAVKTSATLVPTSTTAIAAFQTKAAEGLVKLSTTASVLTTLSAKQSERAYITARVVLQDDAAFLAVTAQISDAAYAGFKNARLDSIVTPTAQAQAQATASGLAVSNFSSSIGQQMLSVVSAVQLSALKTRFEVSDDDMATITKSVTTATLEQLGKFVAEADLATWSGKATDGFVVGLLAGMEASSAAYSSAMDNIGTATTEKYTEFSTSGKISEATLSTAVAHVQSSLGTKLQEQGVSASLIASLQSGFGDASFTIIQAGGSQSLMTQLESAGFTSPVREQYMEQFMGQNNPQNGGASPSPAAFAAVTSVAGLAGVWTSPCTGSSASFRIVTYTFTASGASSGTVSYSVAGYSNSTCTVAGGQSGSFNDVSFAVGSAPASGPRAITTNNWPEGPMSGKDYSIFEIVGDELFLGAWTAGSAPSTLSAVPYHKTGGVASRPTSVANLTGTWLSECIDPSGSAQKFSINIAANGAFQIDKMTYSQASCAGIPAPTGGYSKEGTYTLSNHGSIAFGPVTLNATLSSGSIVSHSDIEIVDPLTLFLLGSPDLNDPGTTPNMLIDPSFSTPYTYTKQ